MLYTPQYYIVASYYGGKDLKLYSSLGTDYSNYGVIIVI